MELQYTEIGEKLQKARKANDLTQSQVGKYLGVAREQISYFEKGKREIDILSLSKLSDLYGYPLEHFLSNSNCEKSISVVFRAKGLTDNDLEQLARSQRFIKNLKWLNNLLGGE